MPLVLEDVYTLGRAVLWVSVICCKVTHVKYMELGGNSCCSDRSFKHNQTSLQPNQEDASIKSSPSSKKDPSIGSSAPYYAVIRVISLCVDKDKGRVVSSSHVVSYQPCIINIKYGRQCSWYIINQHLLFVLSI